MADRSEPPAIIDLQQARDERRHDLNEARLARVRAAFEKALPLPGPKSSKPRRRKKEKPKR